VHYDVTKALTLYRSAAQTDAAIKPYITTITFAVSKTSRSRRFYRHAPGVRTPAMIGQPPKRLARAIELRRLYLRQSRLARRRRSGGAQRARGQYTLKTRG
jgi:hypothetical protein